MPQVQKYASHTRTISQLPGGGLAATEKKELVTTQQSESLVPALVQNVTQFCASPRSSNPPAGYQRRPIPTYGDDLIGSVNGDVIGGARRRESHPVGYSSDAPEFMPIVSMFERQREKLETELRLEKEAATVTKARRTEQAYVDYESAVRNSLAFAGVDLIPTDQEMGELIRKHMLPYESQHKQQQREPLKKVTGKLRSWLLHKGGKSKYFEEEDDNAESMEISRLPPASSVKIAANRSSMSLPIIRSDAHLSQQVSSPVIQAVSHRYRKLSSSEDCDTSVGSGLARIERSPSFVEPISGSPRRTQEGSNEVNEEADPGRLSQLKRNYVVDDSDVSDEITPGPAKRRVSQDGATVVPRQKSPPLTKFCKLTGMEQGFLPIDSKNVINATVGKLKPLAVENLQKYSHLQKDSNSGICIFCHSVQANLKQHLKNIHITGDLGEDEKNELAKALKHNMELSMMTLERRHDRNFAQDKDQWSVLMKDMRPADQNAIIALAESAGICFFPKNMNVMVDFGNHEQWRISEQERSGDSEEEQMVAEQIPDTVAPESYIGDISLDWRGHVEEVFMGSTDKEKRLLARERGLDRQLIVSQHPLLQNLYDYVVRIYTANPRTVAKKQGAKEYARSIVNGGAKWLLVALRLEKDYRTLRTLNDIPTKYFVNALQAYAHAHMELFPSGAVVNFLGSCASFLKGLAAVDSLNANTNKWFTLFEITKQRIAYLTKLGNQFAVSHQAFGRAARHILPYPSLCKELKPMEDWLGDFYENWKMQTDEEISAGLNGVEWNAFGSFLVVRLVLENGQRAEVAYKWRMKDFGCGGALYPPLKKGDKDSPRCFLFPFPTSKIYRSNVKLAASPTLRNWLILYHRIRMILFSEDSNGDDKFFKMFNGSEIRYPLALAKKSENKVLPSNFLENQKLLYFRNSATNTCAGCFLRLNPNDLDPGLFPAQGSMNHQLRNHLKIYATDTSAIVYRAWSFLQKCRNDGSFTSTPEQLEKEIQNLANELVCMTAIDTGPSYDSLSSCTSSIYRVDDNIQSISQVESSLAEVMGVTDQWKLKVSNSDMTTLNIALSEALEEFSIPLAAALPLVDLVFHEMIDFQAAEVSTEFTDEERAKLLRRAEIALEYLGYRYVIFVLKDSLQSKKTKQNDVAEVHVSGLDMEPDLGNTKPMVCLLLEGGRVPKWRNIQVSGASSGNETAQPLTPMFSLNQRTKVYYRQWTSHLEAVDQTRNYLGSTEELKAKQLEHQILMADAVQETIDERLESMEFEAENEENNRKRPVPFDSIMFSDGRNTLTSSGTYHDLENMDFDYAAPDSLLPVEDSMEDHLSRLQVQSPIPSAEQSYLTFPGTAECVGKVERKVREGESREEGGADESVLTSSKKMALMPSSIRFDTTNETSGMSSMFDAQVEELRREDRRRKMGNEPLFSNDIVKSFVQKRHKAMRDLFSTPFYKEIKNITLPSISEQIKEAADSMTNDESVILMQYAANYWPACALINKNERCLNQGKVGRGIKAAVKIRKGAVITDYSGSWQSRNAYAGTAEEADAKHYVSEIEGRDMALFGHRTACATGGGRCFPGPLINHSPVHPNCAAKVLTLQLVKHSDNPLKIVLFYALEDIEVGEELLWTYAKPTESSMSFLNLCPCKRCVGRCHCKRCKGIHFHMNEDHADQLRMQNIAEKKLQCNFDQQNLTTIFMSNPAGDKIIREMLYAKKSSRNQAKFLLKFLKVQGWETEQEKYSRKNRETRDEVLTLLSKWAKKPHKEDRQKAYEEAVAKLHWSLPSARNESINFLREIRGRAEPLSVEKKTLALKPLMRNALIISRERQEDNCHIDSRTANTAKLQTDQSELMALLVVHDAKTNTDSYGYVPRSTLAGDFSYNQKIEKNRDETTVKPFQAKTKFITHIMPV